MHEQFLVALRVHNPGRYEVQRLTDLLQVAAQEKRQYEITVTALEEAIASRNDRIYALELEGGQFRSAWARAEGLIEEERDDPEQLQQTIDGLYAEVSYLKEQLLSAQRRAATAEERCQQLEATLEAQIESGGMFVGDDQENPLLPGPAQPAADPLKLASARQGSGRSGLGASRTFTSVMRAGQHRSGSTQRILIC